MMQNNYFDIDYYSIDAVSQTHLKYLLKSPHHLYMQKLLELEGKTQDNQAIFLGEAIHTYVFEPEVFTKKYISVPKLDRRTQKGKAEWIKLQEQYPNCIFINEEDLALCKNIASSLESKHIVKKYKSLQGHAEYPLFWKDEITSLDCKAKLDYFIEPSEDFKNGIIIDLKTTLDASEESFIKTIFNYRYDFQMTFYCHAVKTIYKTADYPTFIFIAVEKTPPYEANFFSFSKPDQDILIELNLEKIRELLEIYKECKNNNIWKGYPDKIQILTLPQWVMYKYN
jgi:exodeoxyribonuclease VIII